jgi:hypothetical protein
MILVLAIPTLGFSNLWVVCLQSSLGGLIDFVFGLATKVEKSI